MTATPPKSPSVDHFEWGRITIAGIQLAASQDVGALIHSTC